mmetsp:Transcript_39222/g.44967  ORF Transcript_39222/g.44967 Transcript_39222/m.44967 type:complete len:88 (+) Transcript_39222:56-319(+)
MSSDEPKNGRSAMLSRRSLSGGTFITIRIITARAIRLMKLRRRSACQSKSLDDYLLQIRNARKFGFNFNEHKDEKIGILRAFNKKNK